MVMSPKAAPMARPWTIRRSTITSSATSSPRGKHAPGAFAADPEPITIHRLRHTFATERLRAGVSLAAVRKLLGHQNLQTTLRYADLDLEAIKQELAEAR